MPDLACAHGHQGAWSAPGSIWPPRKLRALLCYSMVLSLLPHVPIAALLLHSGRFGCIGAALEVDVLALPAPQRQCGDWAVRCSDPADSEVHRCMELILHPCNL